MVCKTVGHGVDGYASRAYRALHGIDNAAERQREHGVRKVSAARIVRAHNHVADRAVCFARARGCEYAISGTRGGARRVPSQRTDGTGRHANFRAMERCNLARSTEGTGP